MDTPAVVEDVNVPRAGEIREQINKLISTTNSSTFDIAELLYEVKFNRYFKGWGFDSFSKYAKSLELKYSKSFYLVRIVENMKAAALERSVYEPVGLAKLRLIARIDPAGEFEGTPMPMVIRELTLKAKDMTTEDVQLTVEKILGLVEDESMVWINFHLKKSARDNVVKVALAQIKKHLPQTQDEEGKFHDASDGVALEMMAANLLADPNYADPEEAQNENEAQPESNAGGELPAETEG